jgi:hypothetical protein
VASTSGVREREREREREKRERERDGISNQNFLAALSLAQSLY